MIEEYIQCSENDLMKPFEKDKWGLIDIFRVCDRRIGKRRLRQIMETTEDKRIFNIVSKRLDRNKITDK